MAATIPGPIDSLEVGEKRTLFSLIRLPHGDNGPDAVALRVDNNHGAASKESETNRPQLTIVSSAIGDLNRGARKDALRIEKVQASLLEGAEALAGIKADHHAAWQVPSCPRGWSPARARRFGTAMRLVPIQPDNPRPETHAPGYGAPSG